MSEEVFAPALELDGGIVHGATIGQVGDEVSDWAVRAWERTHSLGLVCPICLEPISDGATTCAAHFQQWKRIKADARRLARWIVEASKEPDLLGKGLVVWP